MVTITEEKLEDLTSKLRQKVDLGGYDGWDFDPLHMWAAEVVDQLRSDVATEQAMHGAWRKRAEDAETREIKAGDLLADTGMQLELAKIHLAELRDEIERLRAIQTLAIARQPPALTTTPIAAQKPLLPAELGEAQAAPLIGEDR